MASSTIEFSATAFRSGGRWRARARKFRDDPRAPVGAGQNLLRAPDQSGLARSVAEKVGLSHDDGERIVELVGHAREQGAHRRNLLALQQTLGSLDDDLLERAVVAVEIEVEAARVQEVADPQHDLETVEGLGEEILGAGLERPLLGVAGRVGGQDEDRQEDVVGNPELLDDRDPIQVRHHQIEQDQVGLELAVETEHLSGIRGALDLAVAGLRQHALEESHVRRLVVDDEDPRLGRICFAHRYLTARARSSSSTPRNSASDNGFVR
jgi:hypothetical protein